MAKRDPKRLVADFHLWKLVTDTVDPLRRKPLVQTMDLPLPMPPAKTIPAMAPPKPHKSPLLPSYTPPISMPKTAPGQLIEPRIKRRVGRGQIEIDGTIDLHGMRQDEARNALGRFIHARTARGDRTLLVITGKGLKKLDDGATIVERGVLRQMLPIWLSEPVLAPLIAGWNSAAQHHGGEGAFYVRLRRLR